MVHKLIARTLASLALLALGWPAARPALAAPANPITFNVNSHLDQVDDDLVDIACHTASNTCTLRAAIMQADQMPGAAVNILVPSGTYTLTRLPAGLDGADSGDLNLTAGNPVISLLGAGAASTIIDGNQLDRVLKVDAGRLAVISGLTVRGGSLTGLTEGGGIRNAGILTITNSTVSGNQANPGHGGGLYNEGTLIVNHSRLADNQANSGGGLYNIGVASVVEGSSVTGNGAGSGGGLFNDNSLAVDRSSLLGNNASEGGAIASSGWLTVTRSTLSGNSAVYGGGLSISLGSSLIVVNSTVSENEVVHDGGGLYNFGLVNIYNSTIIDNLSDLNHTGDGSAGGVYNNSAGTVNLRNAVLAGNGVGDYRVYDNCAGTLNSYGWNLFGEPGELSLCTINTVSGNWGNLNALAYIGPLRNNGGPTLTHAPLPGSNAIDGGFLCVGPDALPLATDQRGVVRALGASCDVGAVEFMPPAAYLPFLRR